MQAHRYFIVICISGIFQFLLFIYKRMKAKQITTQQRLASILAGKSSIVRTKIALFFELPRKLPPCEWNGDLLGGDGDMRHHRVIQQVLQDCGGQVCRPDLISTVSWLTWSQQGAAPNADSDRLCWLPLLPVETFSQEPRSPVRVAPLDVNVHLFWFQGQRLH